MTPDKIFVKPMPGMKVRDPSTREPLPAEGKHVAPSSYWYRRKNDGDIDLTEPSAADPAPAPAPAKPNLKKV